MRGSKTSFAAPPSSRCPRHNEYSLEEGKKEMRQVGDELKCEDLQTSPLLASRLLLLKVNGRLINGSINGRLSEQAWLLTLW